MTDVRTKHGFFSYEKYGLPYYGFRIRVTVAKGHSKLIQRQGFRTKRHAMKALTELRVVQYEQQYHPNRDNRTLTVQEYFEAWLTNYAEANCKPSTANDYRLNLQNHIFPRFGSAPLHTIERTMLKPLLADLSSQDLKKQAIWNIMTPFREGLQHAVDDGVLTTNPAAQLGRWVDTKRDTARQSFTVLESEQVRDFLEQVEPYGLMWQALFLTAVRTGLRLGELIGLRWGTVHFNHQHIEVRSAIVEGQETTTKSHRIRRVDMSPQLQRTLQLLREHQQATMSCSSQDWVFRNDRGQRIGEKRIRATFSECLTKANLPKMRIHDLRHTFASLLIQQHANPKYIQTQLGHSRINVTMDVYSHLFKDDHRHYVAQLDD